jgi:sec-independent protein translocase protein TatA
MGFRGGSFGSLVLILLIVVVLFGTKRLREIGADLGAAVKSFRKGMSEQDEEKEVK